MRASLHKSIKKGSVTTVSMCATDDSVEPTLAVFVRNDGRDGGLRKSLPKAGWTKENISGEFGWSANGKNTKVKEHFEMFVLNAVEDVEMPVKAVEAPVQVVEEPEVEEEESEESGEDCRLVTVELPAFTTKETIHGMCVQGADSASAVSTYNKLKYT